MAGAFVFNLIQKHLIDSFNSFKFIVAYLGVLSKLFYDRLDNLSLWVNTNYSDSICEIRKKYYKPSKAVLKAIFLHFMPGICENLAF